MNELKGNNENYNLSEQSISFLIEKKEEYETLKRVISKYLYFIINQNLNKILVDFYFLNNLNSDLVLDYNKVNIMRKKLNDIKNHYLIVTSKVYLKKKKLQTLKYVLTNLKQIKKWNDSFFSISMINNDYSYNHKAQINTSLSYSQIEELLKEMKSSNLTHKTLISFLFLQELEQSEKFLIQNYEDDLSSIFLKQRTPIELDNLYIMFQKMKSSNKNNIIQTKKEIKDYLLLCFKKNIFSVFKGTLLSYTNVTDDSISSKDIRKLSQLKGLRFEEMKMFLAFKQICLNLFTIVKTISFYLNYNNNIGNILNDHKEEFINIISKKIIKVIDIFAYDISGFSIRKWTYQIISCLFILTGIIKKAFNIDNVELLKYKLTVFLKYIIFDELRGSIMRIAVFLNTDTWKRIKISHFNEYVFYFI